MIRANLFALAFDLSDLAKRKPLVVKAATRSDLPVTKGETDDGDSDRSPGYLYAEGVFWGVHLPY